jgi:hypothetical protein
MATSAITALATITLASNQSTVTFSSISGSYRDLRLVGSGFMSGADDFLITFNSDSTNTNYNGMALTGTGSAARADQIPNARYIINSYGLWDSTNIASIAVDLSLIHI